MSASQPKKVAVSDKLEEKSDYDIEHDKTKYCSRPCKCCCPKRICDSWCCFGRGTMICCGSMFLVIAVIICPMVTMIRKTVADVIREGSTIDEQWFIDRQEDPKNPDGAPFEYLDVHQFMYLYHVSNMDDVIDSGATPALEKKGPYEFKTIEVVAEPDIVNGAPVPNPLAYTFNNDGTVSFSELHTYASLSVDADLDDICTFDTFVSTLLYVANTKDDSTNPFAGGDHDTWADNVRSVINANDIKPIHCQKASWWIENGLNPMANPNYSLFMAYFPPFVPAHIFKTGASDLSEAQQIDQWFSAANPNGDLTGQNAHWYSGMPPKGIDEHCCTDETEGHYMSETSTPNIFHPDLCRAVEHKFTEVKTFGSGSEAVDCLKFVVNDSFESYSMGDTGCGVAIMVTQANNYGDSTLAGLRADYGLSGPDDVYDVHSLCYDPTLGLPIKVHAMWEYAALSMMDSATNFNQLPASPQWIPHAQARTTVDLTSTGAKAIHAIQNLDDFFKKIQDTGISIFAAIGAVLLILGIGLCVCFDSCCGLWEPRFVPNNKHKYEKANQSEMAPTDSTGVVPNAENNPINSNGITSV